MNPLDAWRQSRKLRKAAEARAADMAEQKAELERIQNLKRLNNSGLVVIKSLREMGYLCSETFSFANGNPVWGTLQAVAPDKRPVTVEFNNKSAIIEIKYIK